MIVAYEAVSVHQARPLLPQPTADLPSSRAAEPQISSCPTFRVNLSGTLKENVDWSGSVIHSRTQVKSVICDIDIYHLVFCLPTAIK